MLFVACIKYIFKEKHCTNVFRVYSFQLKVWQQKSKYNSLQGKNFKTFMATNFKQANILIKLFVKCLRPINKLNLKGHYQTNFVLMWLRQFIFHWPVFIQTINWIQSLSIIAKVDLFAYCFVWNELKLMGSANIKVVSEACADN